MKCNNICITGIPEGEEREQDIDNLLEKMTANFPNLVKKKVMQVQGSQRVPMKMNPKKHTPRHITIKMAKYETKRES